MNDKILNINYKINVAKWAINQPFSYPIILILGLIIMVQGVAFNNWLLAFLLVVIVLSYFVLFGIESEGVFLFDKIKNRLVYNFGNKTRITSKQTNKENINITKNYISSIVSVNNSNSNNDELVRILINSLNDDLDYSTNTDISDLKINDIQPYLRADVSSVDASLLPTLNDYINDLESLIESKEFKTINNILTVGIKNLDPQLEYKKTKTIKNQTKQLINQTNHNICLY